MNNKDRKEIERIVGVIETAKQALDEAKAELRVLGEVEQEKFDNMSEGLQASENGRKIEAAADALNEAADALDEVEGPLETAVFKASEACE